MNVFGFKENKIRYKNVGTIKKSQQIEHEITMKK